MVKAHSRRSFLGSVSLAAAAATFPLGDTALAAQTSALPPLPAAPAEPFHHYTGTKLEEAMTRLHAKPGNDNLLEGASIPLTIVLTVEEKKAGKEFEFHETRDHVFHILEGTTIYEVGGTPQNARNTKPGEWLAPTSPGSTALTLHKGDMLVIPRGTPHRRTTETSVTLILISDTASSKA